MKKNWMRFMVLALVVLLLPLQAMAQATETPEASAVPTNDAGMPHMPTFFQGSTLDLTPYAGKAIFINFFTGWCQYCMEEMPYIKTIYDDYNPDEVAIILVHVWQGETADDSAKVVKEFGLQALTMVEDEDMSLASLVGIPGYPTSLFISKDGYLHKALAQGLTYDDMSGFLDEMGVAKRVAAEVTP